MQFDVGHAIHKRQPKHFAMIHSIRPSFTGKIDDGATSIVSFRQSRHTIHMDHHRTTEMVATIRMTVDTTQIDCDRFAKSLRIAVSNLCFRHFRTIFWSKNQYLPKTLLTINRFNRFIFLSFCSWWSCICSSKMCMGKTQTSYDIFNHFHSIRKFSFKSSFILYIFPRIR